MRFPSRPRARPSRWLAALATLILAVHGRPLAATVPARIAVEPAEVVLDGAGRGSRSSSRDTSPTARSAT